MSMVVVAIYHTAADAQHIRRALEEAGVPHEDIRIVEHVDPSVTGAPATIEMERGLLYWISGILEADEEAYRQAVTLSRMAAVVQAREEDVQRIETILQRFSPARIDTREMPAVAPASG